MLKNGRESFKNRSGNGNETIKYHGGNETKKKIQSNLNRSYVTYPTFYQVSY